MGDRPGPLFFRYCCGVIRHLVLPDVTHLLPWSVFRLLGRVGIFPAHDRIQRAVGEDAGLVSQLRIANAANPSTSIGLAVEQLQHFAGRTQFTLSAGMPQIDGARSPIGGKIRFFGDRSQPRQRGERWIGQR
jgi:hypothetical protein